MRITFVLPDVSMSGGIRVIAIYAKALVARGHVVTLISHPPQALPIRRKFKAFVLGHGWPADVPAQRSHLDGSGLDHRVLDCWRPVTDADVPDADVVIATWWETAEWVHALNASKGAKFYFIQGHEIFDHLPVERCKASYRLPLHKIVIAQWLANVMRDQYGDSQVDLVHNAVDHTQFYAEVRAKQAVPTVGFLFHSVRVKGVDITLKAIELLRRDFPTLRVISFGAEVPDSDFMAHSGIEFHHSPPQAQLRELYAQCDVWLTASRSEGFNLPAMEAMACRTPVVSTRTGWPEEAIENGKNGMLVDIDDVNSLARGAAWVLALSADAWRRVSDSAYATVEKSSWSASALRFEQILEAHRKRVAGTNPNLAFK